MRFAFSALICKGWRRCRGTLLLVVAWLAIGLALLGVWLPGLPTTEFVLLAAWAAARSSPRLARWLNQHRWFGPLLHDWRDGQRIARRHKITASLAMLFTLALLLWHQPPLWLSVLSLTGMSGSALWLWSRPESRRVARRMKNSSSNEN